MALCFSWGMKAQAIQSLISFLVLALIVVSSCAYAELYRYQDAAGKWHFSDRPPVDQNQKIERFSLKKQQKHPRPEVKRIKDSGHHIWVVDNPLPVTIQIWLRWRQEEGFFHSQLISPGQKSVEVWKQKNKGQEFDFYYLIGEPVRRPVDVQIPPPYKPGKSYLISQGFNGQYSHQGRGSRYAVDIAMPVGSHIYAVKPGIVADARDNYTLGGAASYFLDKANHVTVMHDDGSYAVYAHILQGSLKVDTGQRVNVGQLLARSGNTGFSTGPHLHFVIRYNSGKGSFSVPFKFLTPQGKGVIPRERKRYLGIDVKQNGD